MQFLQKSDLLKLIDEYTLNEVLLDNEDTNLDLLEDIAMQEMTSYLNARYDVVSIFSGQDRNSLIVLYLCDIVLYHAHAKVSPDNIPELRDKRYTAARDWLEKAADGFASPLLPPRSEEAKMPIRYGNSSPKQNHYY